MKSRLLLHTCCIACGAHISQTLGEDHDVVLFFFNPNIFPVGEYQRRLEETERIAHEFNWPLIIGEYDHDSWLAAVKGREEEPEKGKRCEICFALRLRQTAITAKENDFSLFTTTLTVSPHKSAAVISRIGQDLAKEIGIEYLDMDFKKNDGFKKANVMSKELNLYRQDYCGCEFSRRKNTG